MDFKLLLLSLVSWMWIQPCTAQKQHGKASYYSKKITGSRTASGQRLHHDSLVCAHRSYPFGTHLKVTNLSNNKTVIVKVIDRYPFGRGRIIDLSWAAAKKIGMLNQGVASVKVEMLENPIPYRPEEAKLPRIEFDVAESDFKWTPKEHNKKTDVNYIRISQDEKEVDEKKVGHKKNQHLYHNETSSKTELKKDSEIKHSEKKSNEKN